jgi:hypothetical protein
VLFEDQDAAASLRQCRRSGKPADSRTDDDRVESLLIGTHALSPPVFSAAAACQRLVPQDTVGAAMEGLCAWHRNPARTIGRNAGQRVPNASQRD